MASSVKRAFFRTTSKLAGLVRGESYRATTLAGQVFTENDISQYEGKDRLARHHILFALSQAWEDEDREALISLVKSGQFLTMERKYKESSPPITFTKWITTQRISEPLVKQISLDEAWSFLKMLYQYRKQLVKTPVEVEKEPEQIRAKLSRFKGQADFQREILDKASRVSVELGSRLARANSRERSQIEEELSEVKWITEVMLCCDSL